MSLPDAQDKQPLFDSTHGARTKGSEVLRGDRVMMHELQIRVRPARVQDQGRILTLLDQARRQYIAFGREDLPNLLEHPAHTFVLADTGPLLWGIACATTRSRPADPGGESETVWGYLRGLALINGWRTEIGVRTLMEGLRVGLEARRAEYLIAYATQSWMVIPLIEAGLHPEEHIITYERAYNAYPALPALPNIHIRPAQPADVRKLTALDTAAFPALWRLASGEMIEMLVTSGYFAVAEQGDELVGYVCSDVQRGVGQVYRLAVHPRAQGQGIGRALLADALAYCQKAGASLITINTQESNHIADRLYRRFGFRPIPQRVPVMVGKITQQTRAVS